MVFGCRDDTKTVYVDLIKREIGFVTAIADFGNQEVESSLLISFNSHFPVVNSLWGQVFEAKVSLIVKGQPFVNRGIFDEFVKLEIVRD